MYIDVGTHTCTSTSMHNYMVILAMFIVHSYTSLWRDVPAQPQVNNVVGLCQYRPVLTYGMWHFIIHFMPSRWKALGLMKLYNWGTSYHCMHEFCILMCQLVQAEPWALILMKLTYKNNGERDIKNVFKHMWFWHKWVE